MKSLLQCKARQRSYGLRRLFCIDSPIIYGDRVETSKPYHLIYIERDIQFSPRNGELLLSLYRHGSGLSMNCFYTI